MPRVKSISGIDATPPPKALFAYGEKSSAVNDRVPFGIFILA